MVQLIRITSEIDGVLGPPVSTTWVKKNVAAVVAAAALLTFVITVSPATRATSATTRFVARVGSVSSAQLGRSWRPGCPVAPSQLRLVHLSYVGFDGREHLGGMVVNVKVEAAVIKIFRSLFNERFPIWSMVPVSKFGGSDPASMAANNTSGFNCRYAVAPGAPQWSVHAYGEAIDVNPVQNPYVVNGVAEPAAGAPYVNRRQGRRGMAYRGGELVNAFASVGWYWGGRWNASPDYQHFSATGG